MCRRVKSPKKIHISPFWISLVRFSLFVCLFVLALFSTDLDAAGLRNRDVSIYSQYIPGQ